MSTELKYSKTLSCDRSVVANWLLGFESVQLAFAVPVTAINLIVSRYFCYHETDHSVSPMHSVCSIV